MAREKQITRTLSQFFATALIADTNDRSYLEKEYAVGDSKSDKKAEKIIKKQLNDGEAFVKVLSYREECTLYAMTLEKFMANATRINERVSNLSAIIEGTEDEDEETEE